MSFSQEEGPFGYRFSAEDFDISPQLNNALIGHTTLLDDQEISQLTNFFNNAEPYEQNGALRNDLWSNPAPPPPRVHGVAMEHTTMIPNTFGIGRSSLSEIEAHHAHDIANTSSEDMRAASTLLQSSRMPDAIHGSSPHDNHHFRSMKHGRNTVIDTSPYIFTGANMVNLHSAFSEGRVTNANPSTRSQRNGSQLHDAISPTMMNGLNGSQLANVMSPLAEVPTTIHFGSDVNFNPHGYEPPLGRETEGDITARLLNNVEGLKPSQTTSGTHLSDPVSNGLLHEPPPSVIDHTELPEPRHTLDSEGADSRPARPEKRRRGASFRSKPTKAETTAADSRQSIDGLEHKTPSSHHPGKANRSASTHDEAKATPSKRRNNNNNGGGGGNSNSGTKALRENLTEEQKRSNHIQSEQKRRNLIKQGFDELHQLVPELHAGGLSKSSVLTEAAKFLESLIHGNEELSAMLNGAVAPSVAGQPHASSSSSHLQHPHHHMGSFTAVLDEDKLFQR